MSEPGSNPGDVAKDVLLTVVPKNDQGQPTLGGIGLTKKLGQGGMGAVYKGSHPRLGVEVAVKVLPFHLAGANPSSIQYFEREARVAAKLNHPNLVRIFDVNHEKDPVTGTQVYFLVMEFVAGNTAGGILRKRISDGKGPFTEGDALDIVMAATNGLAAAHEENIIHRDIKPDNIIVPIVGKGEPHYKKSKLMDLGLAKSVDDSQSMGLTAQNVAMGTPGYMAPEQAEDAKTAGATADIFSMGATLYALLSGAAPFGGTTIMQILRKTQGEAHPPIRFANPKVTAATAAVIDRCLDKEPTKRFKDAHTLIEALRIVREALKGEVSTERTLMSINELSAAEPTAKTVLSNRGTKPPSTAPTDPATKKSPMPLILAAIAVLLLLGGGGTAAWYFMRGKPEEPKGIDPKLAAYYSAGVDAEKNGKWDGAISNYEKVLGIQADHPKAKEGLERAKAAKAKSEEYGAALKSANDAVAGENWHEAERHFLAAQKLNDTDEVKQGLAKARGELAKMSGALGDALKRASEAVAKRDWDGAEKAYGEALKIQSDSKAAKDGLEKAALARGMEQAAREKLEKAKAAEPDEAWDLLRGAVDLDGEFLEARLAAAQHALKQKRPEWYEEAIKDAEKAQAIASPSRKHEGLSLERDLKKAKLDEGKLATSLKEIQTAIDKEDWEGAEKALEDGRKQHPLRRPVFQKFEKTIEQGRKWSVEMEAGGSAEQRKDYAGAIAAYERALLIKSSPKTKDALKRLEGERQKAFESAIKQAREAGTSGDEAGFTKAINDAKAAWPDRPEIGELQRQFAGLGASRAMEEAFSRKDYPTALEKAEAVLAKEMNHARAKEIRATSKYFIAVDGANKALAGGKRDDAVRLYQEAKAINPNGPELAEIEKALGSGPMRETHASGDGPTEQLALSRDGKEILAAGAGFENVAAWSAETLTQTCAGARGAGGNRLFGVTAGPGRKTWGLWGDPTGAADSFEVCNVDLATGKRVPLQTVINGTNFPVRAGALGVTPDGDALVRVLLSPNGGEGSDAFKIDIITPTNGGWVKDVGLFKEQAHRLVRSSPDKSCFVTGGGTFKTYKRQGAGWAVDATRTDSAVYFWTWPGLGQKVVQMGDEFGGVSSFEFSADGKMLAVGSSRGRVAVVDTQNFKILWKAETGTGGETVSVAATEAGAAAAVSSGKVFLADAGKAEETKSTGRAKSVTFGAGGKALFIATDDGKIRRYAR